MCFMKSNKLNVIVFITGFRKFEPLFLFDSKMQL